MSLIRNLIKTDKKVEQQKKVEDGEPEKEVKVVRAIKSATDLQRFKLEKLMKNPDKPIEIPQKKHDPDYMKTVPDFVRNVMGSSAGAGSGEFHVYRHLRRKEYSRQKYIEAKSKREQLDDEYQNKLEENKRKAEERTAKKRAKRLKKKKCKKTRKQNDTNAVKTQENVEQTASEESSAESEAEEMNNVPATVEVAQEQLDNEVDESTNTPTAVEVAQEQLNNKVEETTNTPTAVEVSQKQLDDV